MEVDNTSVGVVSAEVPKDDGVLQDPNAVVAHHHHHHALADPSGIEAAQGLTQLHLQQLQQYAEQHMLQQQQLQQHHEVQQHHQVLADQLQQHQVDPTLQTLHHDAAALDHAAAAALAAGAMAAAMAGIPPQDMGLGAPVDPNLQQVKQRKKKYKDGEEVDDDKKEKRQKKRGERKRKRAERELQEAQAADSDDDVDYNAAAAANAARMPMSAPMSQGMGIPGSAGMDANAAAQDAIRNQGQSLVAAVLLAATHPNSGSFPFQGLQLPIGSMAGGIPGLPAPMNSMAPGGMPGTSMLPPALPLAGMPQQQGMQGTAQGMGGQGMQGAPGAMQYGVQQTPAGMVPGVPMGMGNAQNDMMVGDAGKPQRGGPKRLTGRSWNEDLSRTDVKSGPFSKAESDAATNAAREYAMAHNKSTDNWDWMFSLQREGMHGMITKISDAVPHRTRKSLWAHLTRVLHKGNYKGQFSSEEDATLLNLVDAHGRKWKKIGEELGRLPEQCRDRWRHIGITSQRQTGKWSEEEIQRLQAIVNEHLEQKGMTEQMLVAAEERAAAGGDMVAGQAVDGQALVAMPPQAPVITSVGGQPLTKSGRPGRRIVLDGINWEAVARKMSTRNPQQCKEKWYDALCPSMVSRGEWGPGDDKRMLRSLLNSGASREWEVDWDRLVQGRNASQCKRRWRLMLKCVPDQRNMEFDDVLSFLVDKYAPKLKQQRLEQQQLGGMITDAALAAAAAAAAQAAVDASNGMQQQGMQQDGMAAADALQQMQAAAVAAAAVNASLGLQPDGTVAGQMHPGMGMHGLDPAAAAAMGLTPDGAAHAAHAAAQAVMEQHHQQHHQHHHQQHQHHQQEMAPAQ